MEIMASDQLIDKAERTKPSWFEDCWEDNREELFPSARPACEDRDISGSSSEEEDARIDISTERRAKKKHEMGEICDERRVIQNTVYKLLTENLPRQVWCRTHRLQLHGNQSASAVKVDRPSPSKGGDAHGQERGRGRAHKGERKNKQRNRSADPAIRASENEHESRNFAKMDATARNWYLHCSA